MELQAQIKTRSAPSILLRTSLLNMFGNWHRVQVQRKGCLPTQMRMCASELHHWSLGSAVCIVLEDSHLSVSMDTGWQGYVSPYLFWLMTDPSPYKAHFSLWHYLRPPSQLTWCVFARSAHSIVLFKGYIWARVPRPFTMILCVGVSCVREVQVDCPNINCVSARPGSLISAPYIFGRRPGGYVIRASVWAHLYR